MYGPNVAFSDFIRYSIEKIDEDGVSGVVEAAREGFRSSRRRMRWLHHFSPSVRNITIDGVTAKIKQQTAAEWDHIQAIRNEQAVICDALNRIKTEDVVWDIGANVGGWTCFLGQKAEVVAFEPIQANQEALLVNTNLNGIDVKIVPRALADNSGDQSMVLDNRGATAGAGRGSLLEYWKGSGSSEIKVPTEMGDELNDLPDPSVIKVDVEGAELQVLQGMRDRLEGVRLAYIELHGLNDEEVIDLLMEADFNITATPEETGCGVLRAET